jgi:hypothetical protein
MQFFALAALFATAMAAPSVELIQARSTAADLCPRGLIGASLQCCSTDVLGLVSLNCRPPTTTPTSALGFRDICAKNAKQAKCCTASLLEQGVLCPNPVGIPGN